MVFVCRTDMSRYASMFKKLKDESHLGGDSFPKTWRKAYHAINNHSTDHKPIKASGKFSTEVNFAQTRVVAGTNGKIFKDVLCYKCQNKGHYADQCPGAEASGDVSCFQYSLGLKQSKLDFLNKVTEDSWILMRHSVTLSNTLLIAL